MILPETLRICGIVLALNGWLEYPGLNARGRVGVTLCGVPATAFTGGKLSLVQPEAQPLEVNTTGLSRSSRESQGLGIHQY